MDDDGCEPVSCGSTGVRRTWALAWSPWGSPVIIDLSQPVHNDSPVYPGDPIVSFTPAATVAEDGYNLLHVRMGSQTGTHVDAPYHFFNDGAPVDELPLDLFLGRAVIADVRRKDQRGRIEWEDLAPVADQLGPGRILVLHTGWDQHWDSALYFDHPFLTNEAASRVIATGVRAVALDAPSLDETVLSGPSNGRFPAHRAVLGSGGIIVENLTNLSAISTPHPILSVLPLRFAGADGAPVRAVALDVHDLG